MPHSVVFTPKAERQLLDLRRYLRSQSSVVAAMHYIDALISYCESLDEFPYRDTSRDDLLPGLRIAHFRGRTVIAFSISKAVSRFLAIFTAAVTTSDCSGK